MTPLREAFVREYLVDLNGKAAYKRARPSVTENTAESQARDLMRVAEVRQAIAAGMAERAKRLQINSDRVALELARIAFFDPRKLIDEKGRPKQLHELDDDTAAAIAGLELVGAKGKTKVTTRKYKIADKNVAIANAMRHLGMFADEGSKLGVLNIAIVLS